MLKKLFSLCLEFCIWYFFFFVWLWNKTDFFMVSVGLCQKVSYKNDMIQSLLFVTAVQVMHTIIGFPFSIYATFVIEEKWGYNKTTKGTFACDQIKSFFIYCVLTALLLPFVLWIIHIAGRALIPCLIGFSVLIILLINVLIPVVFLPLFYTFSEMEESELRTAIFDESEKTGIPVS